MPGILGHLSEYVCRKFINSDLVAGLKSQISNSIGSPVSLQDVLLSSGLGNSVHWQSLSRSAFWMERQEDNVIGVPFVARALAAASDGRRRFASEVCYLASSHIIHLLLDPKFQRFFPYFNSGDNSSRFVTP